MNRKRRLMQMLHDTRSLLAFGAVGLAQAHLAMFWRAYRRAPASTRRRWRSGH